MYASRVHAALLRCALPCTLTRCRGAHVVLLCRLCHAAAAAAQTTAATTATSVVRPPYTRGARNRLAVVRPDLVDDWLPERNELDVQTVLCGSTAVAWWRCPRCRHSYQAAVRERVVREAACCTHCHGTGIVAPALHNDKNNNNKHDVQACGSSSSSSGAHDEAAATASAQQQQPQQQSSSSTSSLACTHPHLLRYWDASRNGLLQPTDVTCDSTALVWWRVPCTDGADNNNNKDDSEYGNEVCFARPVYAFVADTSSPQAALEWQLLQRIRTAAQLPCSSSSNNNNDDDGNNNSSSAGASARRLPLDVAVLLRSADALHTRAARDDDNHTSSTLQPTTARAAAPILQLWAQRVTAEQTVTSTTSTVTADAAPRVCLRAPALDRAAVAAAVRAALLDACDKYVHMRRGCACTALTPVLSLAADGGKEDAWLARFALPSADAYGDGSGASRSSSGGDDAGMMCVTDAYAVRAYKRRYAAPLQALFMQRHVRAGCSSNNNKDNGGNDDDNTAAIAPLSATTAATRRSAFPAPPLPEDALRAHGEMQRRQRLRNSSRGGAVATARPPMRRFVDMYDDEDEAAALAAYPRYRPYALHTYEDDLVEATPVQTTFHGSLRYRWKQQPQHPRRRRPQTQQDQHDTFQYSNRSTRQRTRYALIDPRDVLDDRAFAVEYDMDDEGDIDLATRLRGEAVMQQQHKASGSGNDARNSNSNDGSSSTTTAADAASLVTAAVQAHGESAALLADARAVQYERDVMQEVRPLPAHEQAYERVQTMTQSPRRANNTTRLRRLRLQLPAAPPPPIVGMSSTSTEQQPRQEGAAPVAMDAPRTPHKVARPRRRAAVADAQATATEQA